MISGWAAFTVSTILWIVFHWLSVPIWTSVRSAITILLSWYVFHPSYLTEYGTIFGLRALIYPKINQRATKRCKPKNHQREEKLSKRVTVLKFWSISKWTNHKKYITPTRECSIIEHSSHQSPNNKHRVSDIVEVWPTVTIQKTWNMGKYICMTPKIDDQNKCKKAQNSWHKDQKKRSSDYENQS